MNAYYRAGRSWGRSENGKRDNQTVREAITLLSERRYDSCLDVGTGDDYYAEAVAPYCKTVLAIDISSEAVRRASERLRDAPNIHFEVANVRNIQDAQKQFDLIMLSDVLYYLGDERFPRQFEDVVRSIVSCLRTGGRILLVNFVAPWRTRMQLDRYEACFVNVGLAVEAKRMFEKSGKCFLMVVLTKH